MEWRDSQERYEGAHYKQTKTARCVVQHREVVKLGCNGKGYFNILLYGYWCQYYLREGESEGGGKGRVFVKKANKLHRVQMQSPFIRKNKDISGRYCWWYCGNTQRSQGLQRYHADSNMNTHIPALA